MILLYARTHRIATYAIAVTVLGVLLGWAMTSTRGASNWDGTANTPHSIAVSAALGALTATTWAARGGRHEDALVTRAAGRVRALHPPVMTLITCLVAATAAAIVYGTAERVAFTVRGQLVWVALAFISATLLRASLAWAGPVTYFLLIESVGYTGPGDAVWWNVPMRPPGSLSAWALTILVVLGGVYAVRRDTR